jgi:DNA polymerase III subunit beta
MDVTIQQTSLHRALRVVGRAVATRPTLPILTNVLLHAEADGVRLTGTDAEIGAVTTVAAHVAAPGRAVVPARLFAEYAAQLPAEPVRLRLDPARPRLQVRCGRYTAGFATVDPDEFPPLPRVEGADSLPLDARRLREGLERVAFAAARDESRPVLSAVCLRCGPDGLTLMAADGFRLARARLRGVVVAGAEPAAAAQDGATREVLVPARAAHEFVRLLADCAAAELYLLPDGRGVYLRAGEAALYARLMEGAFPDLDRVIPHAAAARITIETAALRQAVGVASLFGGGTAGRPVRIEPVASGLRLVARGDDTGDAESEIPATVEGETQAVALSTPLLGDILGAATGKELSLEMSGSLSPVIVREVGREEADDLWVVMPMHVAEPARPAAAPALEAQPPPTAALAASAVSPGPTVPSTPSELPKAA